MTNVNANTSVSEMTTSNTNTSVSEMTTSNTNTSVSEKGFHKCKHISKLNGIQQMETHQ